MPCRSRARLRAELRSERRVEVLFLRIRREQRHYQNEEAADDRYEAEQDEEPAEIGIVQATDADREVRNDRRDQRPPPVFAALSWSPSRTSTEVSCRASGSLAFTTNWSSTVTAVLIPAPRPKMTLTTPGLVQFFAQDPQPPAVTPRARATHPAPRHRLRTRSDGSLPYR